jgi:hypothetical protein
MIDQTKPSIFKTPKLAESVSATVGVFCPFCGKANEVRVWLRSPSLFSAPQDPDEILNCTICKRQSVVHLQLHLQIQFTKVR